MGEAGYLEVFGAFERVLSSCELTQSPTVDNSQPFLVLLRGIMCNGRASTLFKQSCERFQFPGPLIWQELTRH